MSGNAAKWRAVVESKQGVFRPEWEKHWPNRRGKRLRTDDLELALRRELQLGHGVVPHPTLRKLFKQATRTKATPVYMPPECALSCTGACTRCAEFRALQYAKSRSIATTKRMRPKLEACGKDEVAVACRCGVRGVKVRCRQRWVCKACQIAFAAKREPMIREGLERALAHELASWQKQGGRRVSQGPQIILLTVSHAHTGDIAKDLEALSGAWRRFAQDCHREWGAAPYIGTWELTPGRCTKCHGYADTKNMHERCSCQYPQPEGHLHLHVATVWWFRDWNRVHELWTRACPSSRGIDIRDHKKWYSAAGKSGVEVHAGDDGKRTASSLRAGALPAPKTQARFAARYVAKYITKGADGAGYTPVLRADVCAAFYNRHSFHASTGFWPEPNRCCRKCHVRIRRVVTVSPEAYDAVAGFREQLAISEHPQACRALIDPTYYMKRERDPCVVPAVPPERVAETRSSAPTRATQLALELELTDLKIGALH